MPPTTVFIYAEADGKSPVLEWFGKLSRDNGRGP